MIRAVLREMEYDAVNVGDYDLAAGASYLLDDEDTFPLLSSNLVAPESGELLFQPYIIRKVRGLRVGIIGLLDPRYIPEDSEVVANDPVEAAAAVVKKLAKKCDLLVALSHLGRTTEKRLLEDVPEIDILVSGGHTGPALKKPQHRGRPVAARTPVKGDAPGQLRLRGRTVAVRTAEKGASLGRLDLSIAPDSETLYDKSEVPGDALATGHYHHTLVELDEEIEDDPYVAELIAAYRESERDRSLEEAAAGKVRAHLGSGRFPVVD